MLFGGGGAVDPVAKIDPRIAANKTNILNNTVSPLSMTNPFSSNSEITFGGYQTDPITGELNSINCRRFSYASGNPRAFWYGGGQVNSGGVFTISAYIRCSVNTTCDFAIGNNSAINLETNYNNIGQHNDWELVEFSNTMPTTGLVYAFIGYRTSWESGTTIDIARLWVYAGAKIT